MDPGQNIEDTRLWVGFWRIETIRIDPNPFCQTSKAFSILMNIANTCSPKLLPRMDCESLKRWPIDLTFLKSN